MLKASHDEAQGVEGVWSEVRRVLKVFGLGFCFVRALPSRPKAQAHALMRADKLWCTSQGV